MSQVIISWRRVHSHCISSSSASVVVAGLVEAGVGHDCQEGMRHSGLNEQISGSSVTPKANRTDATPESDGCLHLCNGFSTVVYGGQFVKSGVNARRIVFVAVHLPT